MQQRIYITYNGGGASGKLFNAMHTINEIRTEDERFKTSVLLKYSQCNLTFSMFFYYDD